MKKRFAVYGMSCAACAARVEKAVAPLNGVESCEVNLMTNSMLVTYDDSIIDDAGICGAVEKAGYRAVSPDTRVQSGTPAAPEGRDAEKALRRFVFSMILLLPLVYITMGAMAHLPALPVNAAQSALLQLLLSSGVIIICRELFFDGFKAIFRRSPNMNTLISVGSSVSFVYSIYSMFLICGGAKGRTLYFESAAMIPTLISLGKYLEARAKGRATDSIKKLTSLTPETARARRGGEIVTLQARELVTGDICIIRQGERLPADGTVTSGSGSVDMSMLTGESIPVPALEKSEVKAGTVCAEGAFEFRVTGTGEDTALMRIVRLVEEASAGKAPVSRLADRVSAVFVPCVMAAALLTSLIWLIFGHAGVDTAISNGVAVLVISCPCALGLATPAAIIAGAGTGAARGILFKTAAAQETAGSIDHVVFDKTGTLTSGVFTVTGLICAEGISEGRLLRTAASGEALSVHPLAKAICRCADANGLSASRCTDFRLLPGRGMECALNGVRLILGSAALMRENSAEPFEAGPAAVHCLLGEDYLGAILLSDSPRPGAKEAVRDLADMGIGVTMLTGDNPEAARAAAAAVGISDVRAGLMPGDKETIVRELTNAGKKVMMVGDGINDAPALTSAAIGAAIGGGTDIAIDSADVVLTGTDLRLAAATVKLGRRVMRIIRENLFWALIYNCIGIPIAAGMLIPAFGIKLDPMFAAAAMSLSSVTVVTNSLRIGRFGYKIDADDRPSAALMEYMISNTEEENVMKKRMIIEGMMCSHCTGRVEKALNAIEGVKAVVDLKGADVTVTGEVAEQTLIDAVNNEGYTFVRFE